MERIIILKVNHKEYAIFWDVALDGKVWARIGEFDDNRVIRVFGKFKTKKDAKSYLETYMGGQKWIISPLKC